VVLWTVQLSLSYVEATLNTSGKVPKMKRIISTLISITLVVSVFAQVNAVGANATSGLPAAQARAASIRFVPRFIRAANKRLRYTIKAKYPQAIGARDERIAKLNLAIKESITKQVNDFKKDFEAPEDRPVSFGSSFESAYIIVHSANNIVSIDFAIETYFEGAAHGNHNSLVFNYDLYSGQMLTLGDLFKSNSNYGKLISDYSIKALTKKLGSDADSDWIRQGAAPTGENYKNWNISRTGLKVTFDPYQVASYAAGPHEVIVPYSILKNVIDPHGPLARLVK